MSRLLRQSTAFTFRIGPFLDSTDFVTAETALTIAQADIQISKNGGAFAQTSDASPTTTHDTDGWYQCPLTATDTGTLGPLTVQIAISGATPVWEHFMVVPANVYDSLVAGSDTLQADLTQIGGVAQSATDLKDLADTGYDPATHKVQGVVLVDTTTTNTDMRGTDSAALASVCTEARLAELDAANLPAEIDGLQGADGKCVISTDAQDLSATLDVNAKTVGDKTGYSLSAAAVQAVWDALTSALTTAGSVGKLIVDYLDAAITSRSSHTAADVTGGTTVATAESNIRGADNDTLKTLSDQADLQATLAAQTTNTTHLTDIKGTGFVKDTNSLVNVTGSTPVNLVIEGTNITMEDG